MSLQGAPREVVAREKREHCVKSNKQLLSLTGKVKRGKTVLRGVNSVFLMALGLVFASVLLPVSSLSLMPEAEATVINKEKGSGLVSRINCGYVLGNGVKRCCYGQAVTN